MRVFFEQSTNNHAILLIGRTANRLTRWSLWSGVEMIILDGGIGASYRLWGHRFGNQVVGTSFDGRAEYAGLHMMRFAGWGRYCNYQQLCDRAIHIGADVFKRKPANYCGFLVSLRVRRPMMLSGKCVLQPVCHRCLVLSAKNLTRMCSWQCVCSLQLADYADLFWLKRSVQSPKRNCSWLVVRPIDRYGYRLH